MNQKTTFLKVVIPVLIIIFGILIMATLITRRPAPIREEKNDPGILVEVFPAEREDIELIVRGTGTVESAEEVSVIPQVSGRIVSVAPNFAVGGFFRKDEILFEVESIDYNLALEQAMAARAKAEYDLATIESQARIARTEWERLKRDNQIPPSPLVLYEPQMKNAQAALASADAAVQQTALDLERTKVRASFNSRVRSESIDQGQYVRTGSSVAVLSGTDKAEIRVPMPLEDMRWLDMPRRGEGRKGSLVFVGLDIGGKLFEWKGHIVRSTGEVDPKTRMMRIVVEVEDPYGLNVKDGFARPALAVGTFVDVRILGSVVKDVFVIPRYAYRDNATVWIMDRENKLQIQNVIPLRIEKEEVIISQGIEDGDMIVLTNVSGAADGMKLRLMK
jgi:RND family efflux transporter MFP subunit